MARLLMQFQLIGINWISYAEFDPKETTVIYLDKEFIPNYYLKILNLIEYLKKEENRYELKYENQKLVEYKNGKIHQVISKIQDANLSKQRIFDHIFQNPKKEITYATLETIAEKKIDV